MNTLIQLCLILVILVLSSIEADDNKLPNPYEALSASSNRTLDKLNELKEQIDSDFKNGSLATLEAISLKNVTITNMEIAENVSLIIQRELENFKKACADIRFEIGIFGQKMHAYKSLIHNSNKIGQSKMDSIIKYIGYEGFSMSQYDSRYARKAYLLT